MNATAAITWTKLRDGSWGISGPADAIRAADDRVQVTKRDGSQSTVQVVSILWTGNGRTIARVSPVGASKAYRSNGGGYARGFRCGCDCDECSRGCRCEPHCNCRGGNIYDC